MADDQPQIYLITPSEIELSSFPDRLAACLDAVAVACVRLSMASRDEDRIAKMADALREVTHARELGADYVAFGPVGLSALGDGRRAETDLFQWWSEMVEVPVVAEGALDPDLIRQLAPITDFIGIGDEIWRDDDAAKSLITLYKAMG